MSTRKLLLVLALLAAVVALSPAAEAQTRFGFRTGAYFNEPDPFVGAEVLFPLADGWFLNPNVEVVFGDEENAIVANGDVHWDLTRGRGSSFWVGAGLAVLLRDPDRGDSETDAGLNLLAGVAATRFRDFIPYLQGKVLVSDDTRGVIAVGVRF